VVAYVQGLRCCELVCAIEAMNTDNADMVFLCGLRDDDAIVGVATLRNCCVVVVWDDPGMPKVLCVLIVV